MGDSAYFVLGLLGALVGYIVGDFQRELRFRRDARANLARAVERLPGVDRDPDPDPDAYEYVRSGFDNVPVSRSHGDGNPDGGPVRSLDGQARRRAVSRPDHRVGADPALPRRGGRRATPQAVGVGYDCG